MTFPKVGIRMKTPSLIYKSKTIMRLLIVLFTFIFTLAEAQPNLQWKHRYNGTSHAGDRASKVIFDNAGNVISTGYVTNACTGEDFITVKFSNTGQKLWSR